MWEFFSGLSILFHWFVYLFLFLYHTVLITICVLSHSVLSDSLWSNGLQPTSLLCPWGFSRQEYWSGLPCPTSGDLPIPGLNPGLLHCRWILYQLRDQGSPLITVALYLSLKSGSMIPPVFFFFSFSRLFRVLGIFCVSIQIVFFFSNTELEKYRKMLLVIW